MRDAEVYTGRVVYAAGQLSCTGAVCKRFVVSQMWASDESEDGRIQYRAKLGNGDVVSRAPSDRGGDPPSKFHFWQ
jgi:hypothetical protein